MGKREGLQGSEDEDGHEGCSLVAAHLKTADDGEGEDEDEDVEGGVPGGVGVPEGWGLEALALERFVPIELDWRALEGSGEGKGDERCVHRVDCYLADGAEALVPGENIEVEVEERELREGHKHLVEDLVEVEVLGLSAETSQVYK